MNKMDANSTHGVDILGKESLEELDEAIKQISTKTDSTINPIELRDLLESDPGAASMYLHNKARNTEEKLIRLERRQLVIEAFQKKIAKWVVWGQGVIWILGIAWILLSFLAPKIFGATKDTLKKELQSQVCRQIARCKGSTQRKTQRRP